MSVMTGADPSLWRIMRTTAISMPAIAKVIFPRCTRNLIRITSRVLARERELEQRIKI